MRRGVRKGKVQKKTLIEVGRRNENAKNIEVAASREVDYCLGGGGVQLIKHHHQPYLYLFNSYLPPK